jgi:hypothetical protein
MMSTLKSGHLVEMNLGVGGGMGHEQIDSPRRSGQAPAGKLRDKGNIGGP